MARFPSFAFPLALAAAAATALGACGSSSNGSGPSGDAGAGDVAAEASTEAGGQEAGGYPAFAVDAPQIAKNQGVVLASPVIVTVTWPGDTSASTWDAFDDGLGASSYWSATTAEYGVGPAASGASNHVHMTQPLPSSLSYTDLQSFVGAAVQAAESDGGVAEAGASDGGAPDPVWPRPTVDAKGISQTIYSLFIPTSVTVTDPGSGTGFCAEGGLGYHDVVLANGASVVYSVTLECTGSANIEAGIEETAAHELVEAATNPFPGSKTEGYVGFDANHLAWDLYTGFNDELADACQNWQDAYYQESGSFPYWVQRSWSNAAASKGHAPCVPAVAGAYHGMTLFPSQESKVSVSLASVGLGTASTLGFEATVGKAFSFQVGFFSDASAPPWKIAYDFPSDLQLSFTPVSNGKATVSIDKTSGQNGDLANVSVTVSAKGAAGFHVMAITWDPPTQAGFQPHYLPVVIVDQ